MLLLFGFASPIISKPRPRKSKIGALTFIVSRSSKVQKSGTGAASMKEGEIRHAGDLK